MRCRSARRSAGSRGIASSGRIDSTGWRSIWKGERNAPGHQRTGGSNKPSKKNVKPMGQATKAADKGKRRELVLARMFDAPRERVWKAWTEPAEVKRWWGPKDFTVPSCKIDLRVGGTYLYCMRSPEGRDYGAPASTARSCDRGN